MTKQKLLLDPVLAAAVPPKSRPQRKARNAAYAWVIKKHHAICRFLTSKNIKLAHVRGIEVAWALDLPRVSRWEIRFEILQQLVQVDDLIVFFGRRDDTTPPQALQCSFLLDWRGGSSPLVRMLWGLAATLRPNAMARKQLLCRLKPLLGIHLLWPDPRDISHRRRQ